MATNVNDIDHAIKLLRKLIKKSPIDSQIRLRLLTLLYANRRKIEYFEEAFMYKANCDISFDTSWEKICEMGRSIDPGNGFYGKGPDTSPRRNVNGRTRTIGPEAKSDSVQMSEPEPDKSEEHLETRLPDEEFEPADSGRRRLIDRRKIDRRKNFSAWFGEEHRTRPRRQKRRRTVDTARRRK